MFIRIPPTPKHVIQFGALQRRLVIKLELLMDIYFLNFGFEAIPVEICKEPTTLWNVVVLKAYYFFFTNRCLHLADLWRWIRQNFPNIMTMLQNNFIKIELVQPNYFYSCLKSKWRVWSMPSGASPGSGTGIAMILFIFLIMKIYLWKYPGKVLEEKPWARRSWWMTKESLLHVTSWSEIGPWYKQQNYKQRLQNFRICLETCWSLEKSRSNLFFIWQRI